MKKWKIVRIITIIVFIIILLYIIKDIIACMNMKYPHPMLGVEAYNWFDQFKTDFILYFLVPLIIDIILFIISNIKIRKKT